jgi:hypothetical protein
MFYTIRECVQCLNKKIKVLDRAKTKSAVLHALVGVMLAETSITCRPVTQ